MSAAVATEPCHRCHGTGVEPVKAPVALPEVDTNEQRELLVNLREAGERRAQHSAARNLAGITARAQAYEDIRVLSAEAQRLHITREQIAQAVGLKRAALYNVLSGKVG